MTTVPHSANKNARQVYREYVELWGFTYEGDTSDGHHVFRYPPTGTEVTLAHSPSAGWAWVKARRAEAAKITGKPFRGKRDAHAAKQRAAKARIVTQDERSRILAERAQARAEAQVTIDREMIQRRRRDNLATIRAIRAGLRNLTTREQRAYAEAAIKDLVLADQALAARLADMR